MVAPVASPARTITNSISRIGSHCWVPQDQCPPKGTGSKDQYQVVAVRSTTVAPRSQPAQMHSHRRLRAAGRQQGGAGQPGASGAITTASTTTSAHAQGRGCCLRIEQGKVVLVLEVASADEGVQIH